MQLGKDAGGQGHAEDLVGHDTTSHWGGNGLLQYMRATEAGNYNYVSENVFGWSCTQRNYIVSSPEDNTPEAAQQSLMESSGHRSTILNPDWTHVALGWACNSAGFCWGVQSFWRETDFEFVEVPNLDGSILEFEAELGDLRIWQIKLYWDRSPMEYTASQLSSTSIAVLGEDNLGTIIPPAPAGYEYPSLTEGSSRRFTVRRPHEEEKDSSPHCWLKPPGYSEFIEDDWKFVVASGSEWKVKEGRFKLSIDIKDLLRDEPGVYTLLVWSKESVAAPIASYSIFVEDVN